MIKGLVFIVAVAAIAIALRTGERPDGTIADGSQVLEVLGYQVKLELGVRRAGGGSRRGSAPAPAPAPADPWPACVATVDTVFVRTAPQPGKRGRP